jgi:hypothetical protein
MKQYPCHSSLSITSQRKKGGPTSVTVKLKHHIKHINYVDVTMLPEALQLIEEHVKWLLPVAMVTKVQSIFLQVTPAQIHTAWREMSKVRWRCDDLQLPSAEKLLAEYGEDVDIFKPTNVPEDVEMLAWGMKKISGPLKGKIVEIGMDVTCK